MRRASKYRWTLWIWTAATTFLMSAVVQAEVGYNRLSARGVIPILIVGSEFADRSFIDRDLDDFVELVASDQYPTVQSQILLASEGRLDLDVKGAVSLLHGETAAELLDMDDGREWRKLIAQRALAQYIADGGSSAEFDLNGDGNLDSSELVVLTFNATPLGSFRVGGQFGNANDFGSSDGYPVNGAQVIGLGDHASLSTVVHELLHGYGAVDVYGPGAALNYEMSVMAAIVGFGETLLPDPWHRIQLGWSEPVVLDLADFRECGSQDDMILYNPAGNVSAGRRPLVVMDSSRSRNEYFLLEHRSNQPGERGIERAEVYADTAVPGTGVTVWSTQVNSSGGLDLLTKEFDPANVVNWDEDSNDGVFATLAISEDGSTYGSGDMIWNQLMNERELKWYDGSDSGFYLTVTEVEQGYSRIQWRITNTLNYCFTPRAPFYDFNPKQELKFPFKKPLPKPYVNQLDEMGLDYSPKDSVVNPVRY